MGETRESMRARYGENRPIVGDYDRSCAVRCVNGTFVGRRVGDVVEYRGIPFVGEQPTGDLRWKAPVDYAADDGVYEALYNGKSPCQSENAGEAASLYVQGEDCLYLDIWKADRVSSQKRPVMVWIHGGGYALGGTVDPMYDCHELAEENPEVIFVSIEYRLNIFGYFRLSHLADGADYPDAQNLGLMDQLQALKWVHENIAAFGGDPDNVTVFGESAGGGSVSMLPLVRGSHAYFRRIIAVSGSPVLTRTTEQSIECTNEVMEVLGCETVADLRQRPVDELVSAMGVLGLRILPERDGDLLPKDMWEAYAGGAAADIDIIQGFNKDEFNYFVSAAGVDGYNAWAEGRKEAKLAQLTEAERADVEDFLGEVEGESYDPLSRLFDQIAFITPVFRTAEEQDRSGGSSYVYYFTPESSLPIMRCGHAMELSAVFNHARNTILTGRVFDETFCKTMRRMWVKFATCGDPSLSAEESPDGRAHEWPAYDAEDRWVMVFDEFDVHAEREAERHIVDWERIYPLTKYYCL